MSKIQSEKIISVDNAKEIILKQLTAPLSRKELINKCMGKLPQPLSAAELKDKSPGGILNITKCRFGNAIDLLIKANTVMTDDEEQLYVPIETPKKNNAKKRKQKAVEPPPAPTLTLMEKNKKLFEQLNPESLVNHSVAMLEKLYGYMKYTEVSGENIDGPEDGGIDGVIRATDPLGFKEIILLQIKYNGTHCKQHAKINDVQKFCGVLAAKSEATKGLFIANKKFTGEITKFAKSFKTKYFHLIDGEKWLELAEACEYDLSKEPE